MTAPTNHLVLSLFGDQADVLRRRAQLHGGLTELRLDLSPVELPLGKIFDGLPWLATCSPVAQGGDFRGTFVEHQARLTIAAKNGADWLDFPLSFPLPTHPELSSCAWVHSYHAQRGEVDLIGILERLRARMRSGDVGKLVLQADSFEDSLEAVRLQKLAGPDFVVFAQGSSGTPSRLWSLALGAPWAYASWPGCETAVGQFDLFSIPSTREPLKVYAGVIGRPVAHSLSPLLWQRAFAQAAEPSFLPYALIKPTTTLTQALRGLPQDTSPAVFSVTTPFKEEAFSFAQSVSPQAQAAASANLLLRHQGQWWAHNTDGMGALTALGLSGPSRLLLLGSGASARAIAGAALQNQWSVTFATRSDFVPPSGCLRIPLADLQTSSFPYGAIIQATPVGSLESPGNLLEGIAVPERVIALDLVYNPVETEFLSHIRACGARAVLGTVMLQQQAVAAMSAVHERLALPDATSFAKSNAASVLLSVRDPQKGHQGDARPALVLIGMRGVGKTTLGQALATILERPFIDLDDAIWSKHQFQQSALGRQSISDWVSADLPSFRQAEAQLFIELASTPNLVLATGGGLVESETAVAELLAQPQVVWLDAPPEISSHRALASHRPPLTDKFHHEEWQVIDARRRPAWHRTQRRRVPVAGAFEESLALLHEAARSFS
ncbi:MAG: type I 3-dehydroquinate dehydratase [Planctomycetes bacterium]|jgi:shikimate dehydrogenase|nr:type I 3-dehydroquinate dehydratase [Planctomycetota bacterium]